MRAKGGDTMEFGLMEEVVLCSALERYISFCEACLDNPANESQFPFIRADLDIARQLKSKIDKDYSDRGGPSMRR